MALDDALINRPFHSKPGRCKRDWVEQVALGSAARKFRAGTSVENAVGEGFWCKHCRVVLAGLLAWCSSSAGRFVRNNARWCGLSSSAQCVVFTCCCWSALCWPSLCASQNSSCSLNKETEDKGLRTVKQSELQLLSLETWHGGNAKWRFFKCP